ncbi:MAG: DUF448 domain-containing protein [Deltaproteobacteria bacterium]|nr:DUF448 domain-containing protein [Deltaproteobacteria bacterium]
MRSRPGPARTCVVCRRKTDPASLYRLVLIRPPEGGVPRAALYRKGPRAGRGAWVCREGPCLEKIRRNPRILNRPFRLEKSLSVGLETEGLFGEAFSAS